MAATTRRWLLPALTAAAALAVAAVFAVRRWTARPPRPARGGRSAACGHRDVDLAGYRGAASREDGGGRVAPVRLSATEAAPTTAAEGLPDARGVATGLLTALVEPLRDTPR